MSKATKEQLAYALAKDAHEGQKYGKHDYFEYHVLGVASEFSHFCNFSFLPGTNKYRCSKCGEVIRTSQKRHAETSPRACKSYDHEAYVVALLSDFLKHLDYTHIDLGFLHILFGDSIADSINLLQISVDDSFDYYLSLINENKLSKKVMITKLKFNLTQPDTEPSLVKRYTEALAVLGGK